jgi:hypothetical protein
MQRESIFVHAAELSADEVKITKKFAEIFQQAYQHPPVAREDKYRDVFVFQKPIPISIEDYLLRLMTYILCAIIKNCLFTNLMCIN